MKLNILKFQSLILSFMFFYKHILRQTTLNVCWRRSMQYPVRTSRQRIIHREYSLFFLSSVLFLILFICLLLCQKRFVVIKYCEKKNCTKFVLLAIQAIIFVCTHARCIFYSYMHRTQNILRTSSIQVNYQKEAKADQLFSS